MSIKALTVFRLGLAMAWDKEIVQIFNRDFTKTFFMLKEDYLAEMEDKDSTLNILGIRVIPKTFDTKAYIEFEKSQMARYGTKKSIVPFKQHIVKYIERMYEGLKLVESYHDIVPDFYTYDLPPTEIDRKFHPEHFLVGSQVTVSPTIARTHDKKQYPSVFTVQGIRANGPDSYCLITTADDLSGIMPEGEKFSFNISHVQSIVSQGKGTIEIQSRFGRTYTDLLSYDRAELHYRQYAKKNHYLAYGGYQIVSALMCKLNYSRGAVVNIHGLACELLQQPFVKTIDAGRFAPALFLINKKRAKRFIKQNFNRFLSSARKEQERQDKEMDDYYFREMEKEFDEEFDRRHPEVKESNDQQDTSGRAEVDESYFADHGDASNNDASVDPDGRRLGDYCHPGDIDESYFD